MVEFTEFKHRDEAATALARSVGDRVRAAVYRRAAASLIMSGGTSRQPLFRALRQVPLPWCSITIVPSDESNEDTIRRELLWGEPGFASFVSLHRSDCAASDSLPRLCATLAAVSRPFDSVVLGMGADGHMASLYPDSPNIGQALRSDDQCVVQDVPRLADARVTLTVRALLDTKEVNLLFFGETKRAVFEESLLPGPVEKYPVRALVQQDAVPVSVYWAP